MATTTKSTRKTSTRSKAAKAPVRKTAAAKRTTANRTATVKKAAVAARTAPTPLERIRSMHISLVLAYLVFAGLVIGFVNSAATAIRLGHQAKDEFNSQSGTVLGGASEVLYNVNPKYVLAASLILSLLASLLLASKWRARYESTLAGKVSGFRWLTIGLSAALLMVFVNMMVGVTDAATLKMSGGLIVVTTMLAWLAERENVAAPRQPHWLAFVISLFTGALAWLPVAGSLIGTSLYGMERFGWHVYALVAAVFLGFTSFALNQYFQLKARGQGRAFTAIEERYWRIDMFTKFAVVLIVLLALK